MGNRWTDQPADAEGDTILHQLLPNGYALQIQQVNIPGGIVNYSGTLGNLFGSTTIIDADLANLLKRLNTSIGRLDGNK